MEPGSPSPPGLPHLLRSQQEYYEARAGEYDEWWERRARYDRGTEANAAWFAERDEVRNALRQLLVALPGGHWLDIAAGTGTWTGVLLEHVEQVTVVDGSPAMLRVHARRVPSERVQRVRADLFQWRPSQQYAGVLAGFWLSHVPECLLPGFLRTLRDALAPGGRVFLVDSRREPLASSPDQPLPPEDSGGIAERRLNDGRKYRIVKVFREPEALRRACAAAGLRMQFHTTERFFVYGSGRRE